MAQVPTGEVTLVFISVVLLAVVELASKTRETDLASIAGEDRDRILMADTIPIPNLGTFPFLHLINFFLLSFSFFIVYVFYTTLVGRLLLLLILALFMSLPFLEVSEYDALLGADVETTSYFAHSVRSCLVSGVVPLSEGLKP